MKSRKTILATAIAGLLATQTAFGLGLGEIKQNSALNEPMDAEVQILGLGDLSELELLVGLGSKAEFAMAGVEREFFLTQLQFKVDLSNGQNPVIRITSRQPIKEPYLDFLMEVQWPSGRLLREYTVLLDLPLFTDDASPKSVSAASGSSSTGSSSTPRRSSAATSSSRATTSASAGLAAGDQQYRVGEGESLWGIARQVRPEDASIHQTMAAIHQINPRAFINGDINMLKSGHVLRLPEGADVRNADGGDVARQLSGARSYSASAGGDSAPQMDVPLDATPSGSASSAGRGDSSGGRLKLSAVENNTSNSSGSVAGGSGNGLSDVVQNELSIVEEELDKTQRENADLRERLTNLENQIETMRRLVELNDPTLAALQDTSGEDVDQSEAAIPAGDSGEGVASDSDSLGSDAPDLAGTGSVTDIAGDESDELAQEASAQAGAPAISDQTSAVAGSDSDTTGQASGSTPKQSITVNTEPAWKKWIDMLLYPLIGLLAILLAIFLFFRNKSEDEDEPLLDDRDLVIAAEPEEPEEDDSLTAEDLAVAAELGETITEEDLSGLELGDDETLDPLGEADIYLSLGNYQQAEDVLSQALSSDNDNAELHLKMLEVHLAAQASDKFDAQFVQLESLGDEEALARAQSLRAEFAGAAGDGVETEDSLDLDDIVDDLAASEPDAAAEFDSAFDTESSTEVASEEAQDTDEFTAGENEALSLEGLDDLDDLVSDLESESSDDMLAELDDIFGESDASGDNEVSESPIELEVDDEDSGSAEDEQDADGSDAGNDLDFDLELDLDDLDIESLSGDIDKLSEDAEAGVDLGADAEPVVEQTESTVDEISVDEAGLDLDAELADLDLQLDQQTEDGLLNDVSVNEQPAEPVQPQDDAQSNAPLFGEELESDLEMLSQGDECATKLDLAEAFLEMGDQDGAREILDEVLAEGNDDQQEKARSLMESIQV
jgi:pilus assembly protein FimV